LVSSTSSSSSLTSLVSAAGEPGLETRKNRLTYATQIDAILMRSASQPDSTESAQRVVSEFVELTQSESLRLRCVFTNKVLSLLRNALSPENDIGLLAFLISSQLTAAQRRELRELLSSLPGGVLGDEQERNRTRVLMDVHEDVTQSVTDERTAVSTAAAELVDVLAEYLVQFAWFDRLVNDSEARQRVLEALFAPPGLRPADRFRILLQQLLSHRGTLPADPDSRDRIITSLWQLSAAP